MDLKIIVTKTSTNDPLVQHPSLPPHKWEVDTFSPEELASGPPLASIPLQSLHNICEGATQLIILFSRIAQF